MAKQKDEKEKSFKVPKKPAEKVDNRTQDEILKKDRKEELDAASSARASKTSAAQKPGTDDAAKKTEVKKDAPAAPALHKAPVVKAEIAKLMQHNSDYYQQKMDAALSEFQAKMNEIQTEFKEDEEHAKMMLHQ